MKKSRRWRYRILEKSMDSFLQEPFPQQGECHLISIGRSPQKCASPQNCTMLYQYQLYKSCPHFSCPSLLCTLVLRGETNRLERFQTFSWNCKVCNSEYKEAFKKHRKYDSVIVLYIFVCGCHIFMIWLFRTEICLGCRPCL